MSTFFRPLHVALASRLAVFSCVATFAALQAGAADTEAPLQLGTDQIGMTSEGIAEATQSAQIDPDVAGKVVKSEWTDDDLGEGHIVFECPPPAQSSPVVSTGPVVTTHARGVDGYESCVEVAVRSGNGFKAASGVCRTLYPEEPSTPAVGAGPPPSEPQASAPVTDDVWEAAAANAPPPTEGQALHASPTQY